MKRGRRSTQELGDAVGSPNSSRGRNADGIQAPFQSPPADAWSEGDGERKKPGEAPARDAEPLYVISVAAKLVRMPAWTLRVLDEQGIVVPKRTDKNRRLYSDRDLGRLARVRTLTEEMGINMNGVRLILQLEEERDKGDRSR